MKLLLVTSAVALVAVAVYQVGVLEKPPFEHHDSLLSDAMFAIVATSTDSNIAHSIEKLLTGTKQALEDTLPDNGKAVGAAAAKLYGAPQGAEQLSIGVYLTDPKTDPKWAVGWAVYGPSKEELDAKMEQMQKASGLPSSENILRVVRIGTGPVIKARIPWRNMFTPMIAPLLHWSRGMEIYDKSGYKPSDDERSTACLEIYVTGPSDSMEFIDYVIAWGDDSEHVWDDTFPTEQSREIPQVMTPASDEAGEVEEEKEEPEPTDTSKEEEKEPEAADAIEEEAEETSETDVDEQDSQETEKETGDEEAEEAAEETSQQDDQTETETDTSDETEQDIPATDKSDEIEQETSEEEEQDTPEADTSASKEEVESPEDTPETPDEASQEEKENAEVATDENAEEEQEDSPVTATE